MRTKNESGYIGKKDMMRESAKRLLKGDIDVPIKGSTISATAPEFMKRRTFKKGGSVKGSELHIPPMVKHPKPKAGPLINKDDGFLPKNVPIKKEKFKKGGAVKGNIPAPIRAGKHPMIGTKVVKSKKC
jgi:hypothetical protein